MLGALAALEDIALSGPAQLQGAHDTFLTDRTSLLASSGGRLTCSKHAEAVTFIDLCLLSLVT